MAFTKLDKNFCDSSILAHGPEVAGIWAYLLAAAGSTGSVTVTVPAMAGVFRTSETRIMALLEILERPDPWSRTPDHDGRRIHIEREPEWQIILLNHGKYRAKDHTAAERQRRHRAKSVTRDVTVSRVTGRDMRDVTQEEAEAYTEGRKESLPALPPPPEERAERATRDTIRSLQLRLGGLLTRLAEHPRSRQMVPAWCRDVTSYRRQDGSEVRGVADFRTIQSIDRLEKSIADAEWHLSELDKAKRREVGHGA